ncbi:C-C motif chemokine 4-like [Pagrus major]|uniref:C-C motif chemokine 4-like n=1 Tax=Pagrus major TaxID=143350 RepID=UPI003CC8AED9
MMKMMMMMMNKPIILVACVLLFSSLAVLASEGSSAPTECCFDIYPHRLPKNGVVRFQYTDDRCAKKAVVITMKKGGVFCVDPSLQWVKNIIQAKEWIHTKRGNSSAPRESQ